MTKMKLVLLFAVFFPANVFCFQVKQIEGIEGHIKSIDFDSDFNSYILACSNGTYYLHKINVEKNISLIKNFFNNIEVIINSNNDLYVFERSDKDYPLHSKNLIWIMKSGARKLRELYYWEDERNSSRWFLDKNDDYLFVTTKYGLMLFKPDQNIPLALTDSVSNHSPTIFLRDKEGSVYFNKEDRMYVFPKWEKNRLTPTVGEFKSNLFSKISIVSSGIEYDENLFFAEKNEVSTPLKSKLFRLDHNRNVEFLHSQFATTFNFIYATKDRLYLTSDMSTKWFNIFFIYYNSMEMDINGAYIDGRYKVAAIEEVFEYPLLTCGENLCANDSLGNFFFAYKAWVLTVKHNETQLTQIRPPSMKKISAILVDGKDNLWVLAESLYFYKNGTTDAVHVADLPEKEDSQLKENKRTGEVYAGSGTKLYTIFND